MRTSPGASCLSPVRAWSNARRAPARHAEEVRDVGMRAEAATANTDSVFVPEDRRDEVVVEPLDVERHHPDSRRDDIAGLRPVDGEPGHARQACRARTA